MKLSDIKVNGKAIHEGAWVGDIPMLPGARLRVRGVDSMAARRLQAKLNREVPASRRVDGVLDPAVSDEIEARVLAEAILLEWEGIEGDDEQPLPCNPDITFDYITDPDYQVLREAIYYAANRVAKLKVEAQERDAGN